MRQQVFAALAAAVVGGAASLAVAGDSTARIAGGSAEVTWAALRFRAALLSQLSPGLSWRIGSGQAVTQIETNGVVLMTDAGAIIPGETALNLRYESMQKWDLMAYEKVEGQGANQWDGVKPTYGTFPCRVWKEKEAKKHTDELQLKLKAIEAKNVRQPDPITPDGNAPKPVETPPLVFSYSKEAQAEIDAAPHLELELRFGDLAGVVNFEAGKAGEAKGVKGEGKEKQDIKLTYAQVPCVRARTELWKSDVHEAPLGVFAFGKDEAAKRYFAKVQGGETPRLEFRTIGAGNPPQAVTGKREAVKAAPKVLTAEMKGSVLTIHLLNEDLVFSL